MDLQNLTSPIQVIITLIALGYGIYSFFERKRLEKKQAIDQEDDRLLKIRGETIEALDRKVKEQSSQIETLQNQQKENTVSISALRGNNEMLVSILQGRDENTQKFQQEGLKAIAKTDEMYQIVLQIPAMNKNIERLAVALESHFKKIERKVSVKTEVEN